MSTESREQPRTIETGTPERLLMLDHLMRAREALEAASKSTKPENPTE